MKVTEDIKPLQKILNASGFILSEEVKAYDAYRKLVEEDVYMAGLAVQLLEQHLINFTDRVKVFKYLSVEQRIAHYISQPSSLFRRIPDHYIATYLGTTAATFSRCLKTINNDKNGSARALSLGFLLASFV